MLRFLWLQDYKNIKAQGFEFDPELKASYTADTGILTLTNTQNQVPKGFYGASIDLVTDVLGENGAGKSTLMSAIMETAGSFANGSTIDTPPCLFLFGSSILHQSSVKLNNSKQLKAAGYKIYVYTSSINFNQLSVLSKESSQWPPIARHCYIHYANFMDSPWMYRRPGVIDVSTSYLLNDIDLRNEGARDAGLNDKTENSLSNYWTRNFTWEVRALNYSHESQNWILPFDLPKLLQLEAKPLEQIYQAKLDSDFFKANQAPSLEKWANELQAQLQSANKLPAIEEFIVRFTIPRLLVLLRVYPDKFSKLTRQQLSQLDDMQQVPSRVGDNELRSQLTAMHKLAAFLRRETDAKHVFAIPERANYGQATVRRVNIDITTVAQDELVQLFSGLSHLPNNAQTFEAHWYGLSSGQIAYLRLYARLYQARQEVRNRVESDYHEISSLTIMIDEGETGFHPKWQKQYMKLLLNIIEMLFGEYRVQLIIGSNSPFIASDIPQSNLLLLSRLDDGNCDVKPWGGKEKTFAANIHTLFTEPFFMDDGLMGDFAREKVSEVIDYLQRDSDSDARRDEMRTILNMIGEPVIRMKLREMWADKFGTAERIADLESQIAELKKSQNNG